MDMSKGGSAIAAVLTDSSYCRRTVLQLLDVKINCAKWLFDYRKT